MTSRKILLTATFLAIPVSGMATKALAAEVQKTAIHSRIHKPVAGHAGAHAAGAATATTAAVPARSLPRPAHYASDANEAVIVTGTHSANRRARQSISPVKVLTGAVLQRSGMVNLADALTRTYASINVEAMGTDAAALVSSIHMRGLSSNQVLVLVDGKRRHTSTTFTATSGPNFGTTGVDLNMLPANMIDHIEVLEDGAAAMYGSDAIAGVVNIITKKTDHGLNMSAQTGANAYNGDGWQYQFNADGGMKLGDDGYLHLYGQMYHTDHMVPKNVRDHRLVASQPEDHDVASYVSTGAHIPATSNRVLSTAEETRENFGLDWGKPLNENVMFYGNIIYAHRHAETYQNYRVPNVGGGVALSYWPWGFTPTETAEENDYAATVGAKGDSLFGFGWDISSTYGADYNKVGNKNTVNTGILQSTCSTDPAAGANYSVAGCGYSPTDVRAESFNMAQWTNNLDLRRNFNIAHTVPMVLAFGAEHRMESYQIWAGNPASYALGGTQGFAGLAPQNAGAWYRNIWAGYIDGDFHFLKNWEVDFAGRFEHYTDVGNAENGKISTRYDITKRIAVRGTISTGFRAPTLAEEHYSAMNVSPNGASGLLAADSDAARSLGAPGLKPERSTNASGGIVVEPVSGFHVEADVYQINIRDRIVQGGTVSGLSAIAAIQSMGFTPPVNDASLDNIQAYYLSNGASTRTQGLDINADYTFHLKRYGNLMLSMALDLNRTRLHHNGIGTNGAELLNAANIGYITTAYPRSKIILNAYYTVGKWDVNIRQTRYGETTNMMSYQDWAPTALQYSVTDFYQFKNSPRWLTDLEIGYRFSKNWHVAAGGNNVFNIRPRRVPQSVNYLGAYIYDQSSMQVPITGGYYYGRVNATF
ncbi:TonB-dependent receptor plug domain-containing protein [Acetobacter fallax]|uniref:TonB-dependent receptor plug domain-containing protein n=1 Tax=Acetobacter fallax TaxID=1737473 RepID=A0ABX0K6F1_9PROT|nr:TonB-dependent receptor [Acetobacter fallax]NHO31388.1 TonB-dependent receptor plug domain-containing protein [Acetobacter fallax]NHO35030.1 TonB-dependent receptor plug domain-containing protein [Acetobacter fallax]